MSSRSSSRHAFWLASGLSLLVGGCLDAREGSEEEAEPCTACHGDPSREGGALIQAAPPGNLDGQSEIAAPGVGAHQLHLDPAGRAAPLECDACHVVPEETFAPGHVDTALPAEVVFGSGAMSGRNAAYDAETGTCSNVYCHGSAEPVWLEPRSSADACGTCHALPPPAPHPASDDCAQCHGSVIGADGEFIAPELHVNGEVNVGDLSCNACHGTGSRGVPPPDLEGNDQVSARGVGAHTTHLEASSSHRAFDCEDCHEMPETVGADGHIDDSRPADVLFGSMARTAGATPTYDSDAGTCADTYCHGAAEPVWTDPRSSADACGTCHGVPPADPHPQDEQCGKCHDEVMDLDGNFIDLALHINGTVEVGDLGCSSCHGTGTRGAPPPDLSGSIDPTSPGVGAHERHLNATDLHVAIPCEECHVVPDTVDATGHRDDPPVELVFGALATANGADPTYSFSANTCTDSYCHGAATPNWVDPLPAAQVCGSCHGVPPAAPHPNRTDCYACHGEVIDADGSFTALDRHIDGTVDVQLACDSCHGSDATGAPPPDLRGNTTVTARGVGAHAVHLGGGDFRTIDCTECHQVPATIDAAGHLDDWGRAEVTMSGVAATENSDPVWEPGTLTCADSWCHGPRGANAASPVWNDPAGLDCASCHGFPPAFPHPAASDCARCHSTVDDSLAIVIPEQHVNGTVDVEVDCSSCHGVPPPLPHPPYSDCARCHSTVDDSLAIVIPEQHRNGTVDVEVTCSSCHGGNLSSAPPPDLDGNRASTSPRVGAHRVHVSETSLFAAVQCGDCHVVPASFDDPGHIDDWGAAEVSLSGAATSERSPATWDPVTRTCANVWCHGPRVSGTTTPEWSSAVAYSCSSCHGYPPADHDPSSTTCSDCHSSGGANNPAAHADGNIDFN